MELLVLSGGNHVRLRQARKYLEVPKTEDQI